MLDILPLPVWALFVFVFGLMIGSFLNVVIYRVPRNESLVFPGSHCPNCNASVLPRDNIPVLSYLLLRGQCRRCGVKISPIYPAVELLVGVVFLVIFLVNVPAGLGGALVADLAFAAAILALIFIDARHQILPNAIIYPGLCLAMAAAAIWPHPDSLFTRWESLSPTTIAISCGLLVALSVPLLLAFDYGDWVLLGHRFVGEDEPAEIERKSYLFPVSIALGIALGIGIAVLGYRHQISGMALNSMINSALGAVLGAGFFWLMRYGYFLFRRGEGMGLGDAKMMAFVGAYLGWRLLLFTTFAGAVLGSIIGIIYLRMSRKGSREPIPFGVFLGIAAILAMLIGQQLIAWWLGTFR